VDGFDITYGVPGELSGASRGTALRPRCVEVQSLTAIASCIGEERREVLDSVLPSALVHGGTMGEKIDCSGFMLK
jgi:hypothetical protein